MQFTNVAVHATRKYDIRVLSHALGEDVVSRCPLNRRLGGLPAPPPPGPDSLDNVNIRCRWRKLDTSTLGIHPLDWPLCCLLQLCWGGGGGRGEELGIGGKVTALHCHNLWCPCKWRRPGWRRRWVVGWTIQGSNPGRGKSFFLFSQASRPPLGLTPPPIKHVPGCFLNR